MSKIIKIKIRGDKMRFKRAHVAKRTPVFGKNKRALY